MNTVLNLTSFKEKLLFTSDWHLNHDREWIVQKRGFKSVDSYNDFIFAQWNEHVSDEHVVVNLGDVAFSDPKSEYFRRVAHMPCFVHHVFNGNHCSGMKQYYQYAKHLAYPSLDNNLEVYPLDLFVEGLSDQLASPLVFQGYQRWARVGKQCFTLGHFPYRVWENVGRDAWMLSGHSHGSDPDRSVESKNGKQLDVGVDNAMKYNGSIFFSFQELERIMKPKNAILYDHHNSESNPS